MAILNGDPENRYPGNVNYSFAYVEGESLLMVCFILTQFLIDFFKFLTKFLIYFSFSH